MQKNMIKPTKRKAFNFLRSYFDVLNELKTDKDKLEFLTAIINKQFLNEEPEGLSFLANLCYQSQRHQIESSVKGWERASNDTLSTTPPTTIGTTIGTTPKEEEEKGEEEEKEQVEEEYKIGFDLFWDLYDNKIGKSDCIPKWNKLSLTEQQEVISTLPQFKVVNKKFMPHPKTYINGKRWEDEIKVVETYNQWTNPKPPAL